MVLFCSGSQFTKTEENIWMNCTDDAHCDVAVMHGWTPEFKTGFITLKNLEPYTTYSVSIRGCNDAGCGNNSTLKVRTGIAGKDAVEFVILGLHNSRAKKSATASGQQHFRHLFA